MTGQRLIAWPVVPIVLGKAAILYCGLEWVDSRECEADFAWFQLHFIKEAENICGRWVREWERGGVSGGQWFGARGRFVGCFSVGSASFKKFKHPGWPTIVLSCSLGYQLLYIEVQCMFTLICVQYLCVSLICQTMTWTTGSLRWSFNDLLMHV